MNLNFLRGLGVLLFMFNMKGGVLLREMMRERDFKMGCGIGFLGVITCLFSSILMGLVCICFFLMDVLLFHWYR